MAATAAVTAAAAESTTGEGAIIASGGSIMCLGEECLGLGERRTCLFQTHRANNVFRAEQCFDSNPTQNMFVFLFHNNYPNNIKTRNMYSTCFVFGSCLGRVRVGSGFWTRLVVSLLSD